MITPLMDFEFYISNINSVYCLAGIMILSRPRRMIHGPALHDKPGIDLQRIFGRYPVSGRSQGSIVPGMFPPLMTVSGRQKKT